MKACAAHCFLVGVVLFGCEADLSSPQTTGESHFLDYCDAACGDGLDCISGVCTRGCLVAEDGCSDLSTEAGCTDASIEPGKVAVCDVECRDDTDCAEVGEEHRCDAGYCRGGEPAPSWGGGGSAGTGGSPNTGGSTPAGGAAGDAGASGGGSLECARGIVSYSHQPVSPMRCESCACSVLLPCAVVDCEQGAPISPCTDTDIEELPADYEFEITPHFLGNVLELDIQIGGGCEAHSLSLCFDPAFRESDPVATTLRLRHETTGAMTCAAWTYQTVRFDLGPLAGYYEAAYATNTGVISTNYGAYGFGELSCSQRSDVAFDQVARAVSSAYTACVEDSDCQAVGIQTPCTGGCEVPVSSMAADALSLEIERIGEAVCGDSCEAPVGLCAKSVVRCEEGECRDD